ncbi:Endosomal targeting BRO1-like domain-containing protein [Euphorbia peplus]|nr:Endosomal targeting BRO1-like domain-containing protein [Euphorbia peplus]
MGCTTSMYAVGRRHKKMSIPEIALYFPSLRIPAHSDIHKSLKSVVPKHLLDRLTSLRNQITLISQDTCGSAVPELRRSLEEYLPLLVGLTKKENGLENLVEFKWKDLEDGEHENPVVNSWFELLSVLHMMAILTLSEANSLMIPKDDSGSGVRLLSSDCKRDAVGLLLKAAGYLEFCVREILIHIPQDIKKEISSDLQSGLLEAISIQALGQGTEIQLGLAVESQKASLSVKRRLACEQLIYFSQAYQCLSGCDLNHQSGKKLLWFIKWKFLESKAGAYYYHGLIVDKGSEPVCHVSAVCCFLAAEQLLTESKKACLSFCLTAPVSRCPPLWGAMKHLHQKIPEVASKKSQMYGYLLEEDKALQALPELPDFQLSLRPDDYVLPEKDEAWNRERWELESQSLKEHLNDSEDDIQNES